MNLHGNSIGTDDDDDDDDGRRHSILLKHIETRKKYNESKHVQEPLLEWSRKSECIDEMMVTRATRFADERRWRHT